MKIIILGAGQVGSTLAEHLASENNDITVIDNDPECISRLEENLDIRTFVGNASHPNVLSRAGAEEADLLIAVTNSDENNMIACQVAHTLFQTPKKIARIRSLQYLAYDGLFDIHSIPVDVVISPEQMVTNHIRRLIERPDALQIFDFANKKVQLVLVKADKNGAIVGQPVKAFKDKIGDVKAKIVAIFRDEGEAIVPNSETIIQQEDKVFFITAEQNTPFVLGIFKKVTPQAKRIVIAGGGNVGTRLAIGLEDNFKIKVIEHNLKKVEYLATHLKKGIVLHGEVTSRDLLYNENIENTDIFCAVTNNDETNIMASLLAKHLGASKVLTLVNKIHYIDVIRDTGISSVISPQQTTIGSLLTHIRQGDVVKVHSLRKGKAEAIEAIIHGNEPSSPVVGKKISEIELPEDSIIGAVVRNEEVIIDCPNTEIQQGDHIIVFVSDKEKIPVIEDLFVSVGEKY